MLKSLFRWTRASLRRPASRAPLGLCLLATVVAACSIDISKLRVSKAHDGAIAPPAGSDAVAADSTLTTVVDVGIPDDVAVLVDEDAASDFPLADERVVRDAASVEETATPDDAPATADLSVGPEVSGEQDGASGGTGGSGTGGTGAGGSGTGGSGTGGSANGGTGGGGTGGPGTGGAGTGGGGTGGGNPDSGTRDANGTGDTGPDSGDATDSGYTGPDPDLVLWYKFDESAGTTAADSAMFGGVARNATLTTVGMGSSAVFSTMKQVGTHAVDLTPSNSPGSSNGGYVIVPALGALAPNAITIAVWVNLAVNGPAQNWERIFDYGNSSTGTSWFNLSARTDAPGGPVQFAISNVGHGSGQEQHLTSPSALSVNVWHHVAIVLPVGTTTYTGTMYIDGVAVATNSAMTLHLADLSPTSNNWLGRSQFTGGGSGSVDPYFNGSFDDFRVYKRALTQQEITALIAVR